MIIAAVCLMSCEEDGITSFNTGEINKNSDIWNVPYDQTGTYADHSYVDLGLSVLWSTCNINASHPLMSGDYFAWGETTPKTVFNWDNYIYRDKNALLTKYNHKKGAGSNDLIDSLFTLLPEDDAAVQLWGNGWRMPEEKEVTELRERCTWEWVNGESANYHKVTGPSGNSILLPACGSIRDKKRIMYMENGCLWTSSISVNVPEHAYELTQYATGYWIGSADRFYGEPIRPVIEPKNIKN